jgi:hypothetical protein
MKKYILLLIAFILVISIAGLARENPAWASILPAALRPINAPRLALSGDLNSVLLAPDYYSATITGNGIYNIGGVCTIEVEFTADDVQIIADSEVQHTEIKEVPYYGQGNLLYPGCHIVHYKQDEVVTQMEVEDGSSKICFGASPILTETIHYYLDSPPAGSRTWIPLPTHLEDKDRLVCAPALHTGLYMPIGEILPYPGSEEAGTNLLIPGGFGGSVQTPDEEVYIAGSGTYAVGGICLIRAEHLITGLADIVRVEFPASEYSEDTLTVPADDVEGIFYYPGCHVIHYRDQVIRDEMTREEGNWEICFAAIPEKEMTIYYYADNETDIVAPWIPLETTTENGLACAVPVDFSAVYAPVGK